MTFAARVAADAAICVATFGQAVTYYPGGDFESGEEILGVLDFYPMAAMDVAVEIPAYDWALTILLADVADPGRKDMVDLVDLAGVARRCQVVAVMASDHGCHRLAIRRGGPVPEDPEDPEDPEPEP